MTYTFKNKNPNRTIPWVSDHVYITIYLGSNLDLGAVLQHIYHGFQLIHAFQTRMEHAGIH